VHTIKERLSVEETEQRSARSERIISFEEILRYEFSQDPRNVRSAWEIKILKGIKVIRDRKEKYSMDSSSEDFMNYQLRSVQEGTRSFQIVGSRKSASVLSLLVHTRERTTEVSKSQSY
jgi:hypothetical protein